MNNFTKKTRSPWYIVILTWILISIILYITVNRVSYVTLFTYTNSLAAFKVIRNIEIFNYITNLVWAFAGVSLFTVSCLSAGAKILEQGKITTSNLLVGITGFIIGEIFLSCIIITLAVSKLLSPFITITLLAMGLFSGWKITKNLFFSRSTLKNAYTQARFEQVVVLLLIFTLGAGLLLTSARLSYDSVTEYFSNAKHVAISQQTNLLFPLRGFAISALHSSILFSAIIQLFGDQAARMLSWVNGLVILAAGWEIGKAIGLSTRARFYFLTLILTSTAFVDLLGDGKVELISTAPIVVALWWMVNSLQNPSRERFLLIGALLGFAIIARPYNIFLIPVFTVLFYLFQVFPVLRKDGFSAAFHFARPVLWMFPTLLAMGAFHLWQNDLWLGSPLAPLTFAHDLEASDWQWQFDPASLNTLRLLYPLTVTFMNTPQSLGNISPLFIGILPFLLLGKVHNQFHLSDTLRSLLLPALVTMALWITLFFTVVEIRYVFFLWVLFFLFGAKVIEAALNTLEKGCQAILRATLALLLVFIMIRTLVISLVTYSPIDANGQAHCYDISFCTFLDPLNESATEGERVFVLNAYRYYLRPDLFACSSQAQEYLPLQSLAKEKSGQFWVELYRQGFRYVAYEKNFALFHSRFGRIPAEESAPEWLTIIAISFTGSETVYELQPTNPPFLPLKTCTKTDDGIWQVTTR